MDVPRTSVGGGAPVGGKPSAEHFARVTILKSEVGFSRGAVQHAFVKREQTPGRAMKSTPRQNQKKTGPAIVLVGGIAIMTAVMLPAFTGCAPWRGESGSWRDPNELLRNEDVAALNALANDPAITPAERARAVFSLFSQHLRPGCSAAEVRRVLTDTAWLQETRLLAFRGSTDQTPVEMTSEDTVFGLHLFPGKVEPRTSPWVIYFRLSGRHDQDGVAHKFLTGAAAAPDSPRMLEFALCLNYSPGTRELHGRMERVSSKGIHIFEEW